MSYLYVSPAPYLNGRMGYPQNSPVYPQQIPAQQEPGIVCRPVTSIEEAKSIPTDFNGNLMVFPDLSHGMIHTKQLNYQDGSAIFKTYMLANPEPVPMQETPSPVVDFAPMSEVEGLKQEISQLKAQLEALATGPAIPDKPRTSSRGGTEK